MIAAWTPSASVTSRAGRDAATPHRLREPRCAFGPSARPSANRHDQSQQRWQRTFHTKLSPICLMNRHCASRHHHRPALGRGPLVCGARHHAGLVSRKLGKIRSLGTAGKHRFHRKTHLKVSDADVLPGEPGVLSQVRLNKGQCRRQIGVH